MVFRNDEYKEFFNDKVVFYKLTSKVGEEAELRAAWSVPGYPTVILYEPTGKEIDRKIGFDGDAEAWMKDMRNWVEGRATLQTLQQAVEAAPDSVPGLIALARKYVERYETAEASLLYAKILELDPDDQLQCGDESRYYLALTDLKEKSDLQPMKQFLADVRDSSYLRQGRQALIAAYRQNHDISAALNLYEDLMADYPEDTGLKNAYAWMIFQEKVTSRYEDGITAAREAVTLAPDADNIWDTLAQLLFVSGRKGEAIAAMEEAVRLVPDDSYYSGELTKFKGAE